MILKNGQSILFGKFLLFIVITTTLNFCTNRSGRNIEIEQQQQQQQQQRLSILLDSIKNNDIYRIPKKVLNRVSEAIPIADELKDSISLCQLTIIKAGCFKELGNSDSSFIATQKAIKLAENIHNDTLLAKAHNSLGNFYMDIYDYVKATNSFITSLSLFEKVGNKMGVASTKNNLGVVYRRIGEPEKAIECYTDALHIFDSVHDEFKKCFTSINLFSIYSQRKDTVNTRIYYAKSFSLLEKRGDTLEMTKLLINQGLFYKHIGKIDSAIITFNQVIDNSKAINNKRLLCYAFFNLGVLYYSPLNDFSKAKIFIEKCLTINQELSDLDICMKAKQLLSEIENSLGNYKKSNDLFKQYVTLKDSIEGGGIKKEIMAIEMQNNLEKQEYKAMLLKQKLKIRVEQNIILIISLVALLLLAVMTIFVVRTTYNNLKKSNAIKELEKQRLQDQIEKDRNISEMEKLKHDTELKAKNKELVSYSLKEVTKNDLLDQISRLSNNYYNSQKLNRDYFNDLTKIIKENLNIEKEWGQFKVLFEKVHHGFFDSLKNKCPKLTEYELRFCAYVKINLSPKEISRILNVSPNTVKTFRYRLKKRLNLEPNNSIEDFIRNA